MISLTTAVNNDESDKLTLELKKQKDKHHLFKSRFLSNLSKIGLEMETVRLNKTIFILEKTKKNYFSHRMSVKVIEVLSILLKFIYHGR